MMELMLDKKDAALVLLAGIAKLKRYPKSAEWRTLNVPLGLLIRIDLVLDFPDEPGEEACKET